MELEHVSVLLDETINNLNIKPYGIYVDATLGGGGHSLEILKRLKTGHLYCFDQDSFAIEYAKNRLANYQNYTLIHANFSNLKEELAKRNVDSIDGIIFDLGLSSFQIDDKKRGFSYLGDNQLDMRMDQEKELTAKTIVNSYNLLELSRIFYLYGEEQNSYQIAKLIIKKRPINTTSELVEICDIVNKKSSGHSAKKVFQALRIAVNNELDVLEKALSDALTILKSNARICVISFHSLEDRIVKHFFLENAISKQIKNLPIMIKDEKPLAIITKKPIYPSNIEINKNKRSQSAKLRVAYKK